MSNRNKQRTIKTNDDQMYRKHFEDRGLRSIKSQYSTGKINYPTEEELSRIPVIEESWKLGDRLYKYAKKYYNNEEYWWLIAWINKKPTEQHFNIGDTVKIIANLDDAMRLFYE